MLRKFIIAGFVVLYGATLAQASVVGVNATQVDKAVLPTYITNDITVDFNGQLSGQAMILSLTSGSVYQDNLFGSQIYTPPSSGQVGFQATLAYDTIIGLGSPLSDGANAHSVTNGEVGAVNIDPLATYKFDTTGLNVTWFPPGGSTPIVDQTGYFTSRITLSNDANGTFRYFGTTTEDNTSLVETRTASIVNGVISFGTVSVDPIAVGNPVSGSSISLQGAFDDGTGLLANAITLTNGEPGSDPALEITSLVISDDAEGLFSATFNGLNIDLGLDIAKSIAGPGRNVSALLTVNTNGGVLTYNLGAAVPEPSTVALSALALVGLVGFARRKK